MFDVVGKMFASDGGGVIDAARLEIFGELFSVAPVGFERVGRQARLGAHGVKKCGYTIVKQTHAAIVARRNTFSLPRNGNEQGYTG